MTSYNKGLSYCRQRVFKAIKARKSMQYQWIHEAQSQQQTWLFKRNCALSPRQLAMWFGGLSLMSLSIATGFVAYGAWFVLIFACIEVIALGVAFVVYAKHAADYDRVIFSPSSVRVEKSEGGKVKQFHLEPSWLKVEYDGKSRSHVVLVSGVQRVTVGRFVPDSRLLELTKALRVSAAVVRN
jgi:uncharacterized membrane protein